MNHKDPPRYNGFVPVLILAVLLVIFRIFMPSARVIEPPLLLFLMNTVFIFALSCAVAYVTMRSYLIDGSLPVLMLGSGVLTLGVGGMAAGWAMEVYGPNMTVTVHNLSLLMASIFYIAGVTATMMNRPPENRPLRRKRKLMAAYSGVALFIVLLLILTAENAIPKFFVQGAGPTVLRQGVLAASFILFVISSSFMFTRFTLEKRSFFYWYSLALALLALGIVGIYLQPAVGSLVGWVGRGAFYLAGIYFLFSVKSALRDAKTQGVTLDEAVAELFHTPGFHWQEILKTSLNGFWIVDGKGRFLEVNEACCRMLGYTRTELLSMTIADVEAVESPSDIIRRIESIKEKKTGHFTSQHRRKDGSVIDVEANLTYLDFGGGQIAVFVQDITERKRAEDAIRESEDRLRFALETSHTGAWNLDLVDHTAFRSLEHDRIFGYSELLPQWTYEMFLDHVLPEDRAAVDAKFRHATDTRGDWSFECRIRRRDGEVRWIWAAGRHRTDAAGGLRRMAGIVQDITARKQAEKMLQEAHARTAAVLAGVADAFYSLDSEWRFVVVNPAAERAPFGQSADKLLGRVIWDVYPTLVGTRIQQHYFDAVEKCSMEHYEAQSPLNGRWYEVFMYPWKGGLDVYLRDIDDRKRAEEELQTMLQRMETFVAHMHSCILLMGEGRVVFANRAFCDYFELPDSPAELVGTATLEMIEKVRNAYLHPDEEVLRIKETLDRGEAVIGEEIVLRDGRTCLRDFIPISADGKSYGRIWQHIDITERKRMEEDLKRRTLDLEAANQELEEFTYTVSHDLRSPLRAIDGFSRMLARDMGDNLDDEAKRKLNVIRDNVQKMGQLIADLLAFSRLGRQSLSLSDVDMEDLAEQVWRECQTAEPGRRMDLKINIPPKAFADSGLVKQVLSNLISNAVKFTKSREEALIEIGGRAEGRENVYYVKDNGIGFDMKYYDMLFGVFQRLHNEVDYEGTGVGLAIVQRIIHRHGGRVWAEGKLNEGATFYFSLPPAHTNSTIP